VASFLRAGDPPAAAAVLLISLLERIDLQRGAARLAVAGGSAAAALGALRRGLRAGVWDRLLLTWVDERCVPFADPQSNRGGAYRDGQLDPADPPGLELPLYLDGETPVEACARVAASLDGAFQGGLDALLLGMGEDGHIASLFPGRPFERIGEPPVFAVPDSPKPPRRRITLALSLLAAAEGAVLVASGEAKRAALERLAAGDPELPGSALPNLTVITDAPGGYTG
jgi:6-phosphogluconolactonase